MTNTQPTSLQIAKASAYQMSRITAAVVEVRQVGANDFTYCERGATDKGMLVGAFLRGEVAA
jgi:hypothetical protein